MVDEGLLILAGRMRAKAPLDRWRLASENTTVLAEAGKHVDYVMWTFHVTDTNVTYGWEMAFVLDQAHLGWAVNRDVYTRWAWVPMLLGLVTDKPPVLLSRKEISRLAADGYTALVEERLR